MGSPDPEYGRQLNGMGGGVSSLSKICVVGPPSPEQKAEGIDVEYTFVQVGIRDSTIDYSGNCGNLSSMIGVYALDAGLCKPSIVTEDGNARVRSFNTNTSKVIETTFPLDAETGLAALDLPQTAMAGVPGKASQVVLDFVNPSGARTGKLLPTGSPVDTLNAGAFEIRASLVDATNPSVFVLFDDLVSQGLPVDEYLRGKQPAEQDVSKVLETIRQAGAVAMGLDPSAKAQPKIAMLHRPQDSSQADIVVYALSMGVLHKAVPMTLGLCLGVAAKTERTLAWDITQQVRGESSAACDGLVRILHPGGVVDVGAEHGSDGSVTSAKVVRTGRRLMVGSVYW
jgi:2-methylaconitate cis-trans-isomerase PrpF